MSYHRADQNHLASFGADMSSERLQEEHDKFQAAWKKANNVGGLPIAINLMLAVKYQKLPVKATEEPTRKKPGPKPKMKAEMV